MHEVLLKFFVVFQLKRKNRNVNPKYHKGTLFVYHHLNLSYSIYRSCTGNDYFLHVKEAKGKRMEFTIKKRCKWRILFGMTKKEFKEDLNFFPFQKIFSISGLKMQIIAITFTIYPFFLFYKKILFSSPCLLPQNSHKNLTFYRLSLNGHFLALLLFLLLCFISFCHCKAYFMFV